VIITNPIDIIKKMFAEWREICVDDETFSLKELKLIFLSSEIVGLTTYDYDMDKELGEMILETMIHIKNRTNFDYIEDNYRKYIISCNFIINWLNWGDSIRGAWFDPDGEIETPYGVIATTEEFMGELIDFLSN
jgi:hypothetical protein